MARFKIINFLSRHIDLKLDYFSKKVQIFEQWGFAPQDPVFGR